MAKRRPRILPSARVLPTLEKELWQSGGGLDGVEGEVLPTLEKELWQSFHVMRLLVWQSCRRWKRNCGKALGRLNRLGRAVLPTLEKELWQSGSQY